MLGIRTSTNFGGTHSAHNRCQQFNSSHGAWFLQFLFFSSGLLWLFGVFWADPVNQAIFWSSFVPTASPALLWHHLCLPLRFCSQFQQRWRQSQITPAVKQVLWQLHFHSLFFVLREVIQRVAEKYLSMKTEIFLKVESPAYTLPTQTKSAFNFFLRGYIIAWKLILLVLAQQHIKPC